jgi:peroxiredoxin
VAISYDDVKVLTALAKKGRGKRKVTYPLLSDPESKMIKAFGILNEKHKKGHKWHGVPHPYIFIVDADGKVLGKLSEIRYQKRPTVNDILNLIKKFQKK